MIEKPDLDILSFFVDMQEKRVQRNEGKTMTPRIKKLYEADVLKLDMMRKYIELEGPVSLDGEAPKKKKVKRNV